MSETHDIIRGTIGELEERESALVEEIERVQTAAKAELKDVRRALGSLRKQLIGASPNGREVPPEITNETKDRVLAALEGGSGARAGGIAEEAGFPEAAVRVALAELEASGDVEPYGRGFWRIAE
jgi:hypothetical protein